MAVATLRNDPTFSRAVEHETNFEPVPARSVLVQLVQEEGEWVATAPMSGIFGEGNTPSEAVEDLIAGLGGLRDSLGAEEAFLSDHLANRLAFLRSI